MSPSLPEVDGDETALEPPPPSVVEEEPVRRRERREARPSLLSDGLERRLAERSFRLAPSATVAGPPPPPAVWRRRSWWWQQRRGTTSSAPQCGFIARPSVGRSATRHNTTEVCYDFCYDWV